MAIKDGGYAIYENVITDSITGPAVHVEVKNCAGGSLSIRTESKKGDEISKCDLPTSCGDSKWVSVKCSDLPGLKGVQDFYVTASGLSGELLVGNIKFSKAAEAEGDSLERISAVKSVAGMHYDGTTRTVELSRDMRWTVFDLNGVEVRRGFSRKVDLKNLGQGSYLVRAGGSSVRAH